MSVYGATDTPPASRSHPTQHLERSKSERKKKREEWFETSIAGGIQVLSIIEKAAEGTPIPYLKLASAVTLGIVEGIQAAKDNRELYTQLGKDSTDIVIAILGSYERSSRPKDWPGEGLQSVVNDVIETLQEIKRFVSKKNRRNGLVRWFTSKTDADIIQVFRERLNHSTNKLGVVAHLENNEILRRLERKLHEATSFGAPATNSSLSASSQKNPSNSGSHAIPPFPSPFIIAPNPDGSPTPASLASSNSSAYPTPTSSPSPYPYPGLYTYINNTNSGNIVGSTIHNVTNDSSVRFYSSKVSNRR